MDSREKERCESGDGHMDYRQIFRKIWLPKESGKQDSVPGQWFGVNGRRFGFMDFFVVVVVDDDNDPILSFRNYPILSLEDQRT